MDQLNEGAAQSTEARKDAERPVGVFSVTFLLTNVTYIWQFFYQPKDGPRWPY